MFHDYKQYNTKYAEFARDLRVHLPFGRDLKVHLLFAGDSKVHLPFAIGKWANGCQPGSSKYQKISIFWTHRECAGKAKECAGKSQRKYIAYLPSIFDEKT